MLIFAPPIDGAWVALSDTLENETSRRSRRNQQIAMWFGVGIAYLGTTWTYFTLRSAAGILSAGPPSASWVESLWLTARATAYYAIKLPIPWPQSAIVVWEMTPGALGTVLILSVLAAMTGPWRSAVDTRPSWSAAPDDPLVRIYAGTRTAGRNYGDRPDSGRRALPLPTLGVIRITVGMGVLYSDTNSLAQHHNCGDRRNNRGLWSIRSRKKLRLEQ